MSARDLINHIPALPEIIVLLGACMLMLVDLYVKSERRVASVRFALGVLAAAAVATLFVQWVDGPAKLHLFYGLFVSDALSNLLKLVCYASVWAALVYSRQYLLDRGLLRGEFITLLLFALLGMMIMISASSFLTIYLGLELMSLCLYALVALNRDSPLSTEAAMKYFVLGALSSGLLLYGMSMVYGATGTLSLTEVARVTAQLAGTASDRPFLVFGLVFVVAGLAFKIGVAPFHMWIPDVYHGAQGRGLRHGGAPTDQWIARPGAGLAGDAGDPRAGIDGDRQHHRHRAVEPEAHARLLDHRAHGLHAARPALGGDRRQPAQHG
jgi:NADH-quinone oxidoreductase subunit N